MSKNLYQVHCVAEVQPTIVSENKDIHGCKAVPQIIKSHRYVVAKSTTDAKLKLHPRVFDNESIYALQVSEQTIKDEIMHCREIIAFWNSKSEEVKKKERVDDLIIPRQQNLIKYYENILKELKDDSHIN